MIVGLKLPPCLPQQVNSTDNMGQTALHRAAREDIPEACRLLLSYGADTTVLSLQGFTPVQLASEGVQKIIQGIAVSMRGRVRVLQMEKL